MFSRQRKARVLFALSDFVLVSLAFAAAYETRLLLPLARQFYMTAERAALVLGFAVTAWVLIGLWLEITTGWIPCTRAWRYGIRARQCALGAVCLALLQYSLRLYPEFEPSVSGAVLRLCLGLAVALPAYGQPHGWGVSAASSRRRAT